MSWNPKDIPIERPSSFDETGKRVFLYPAKVSGKYKRLRTTFYLFLLFVFLVIPWTTFNGEQTLLFDLVNRRFVFFGISFSAHDGPLIFFPLILASLGLGFITSLWGRVWCGWACPQTVFLESLFRVIDQWVEGSHSQRMKHDKESWSWRKYRLKLTKWALFFVICSHIAHSFTAYFVGAKNLFWLTTASPLEHWALFLFVQTLTLILLFNFGWFREQFCIIMCPYGRFQSVLMGKKSLAILYDEKRGEPRRQGREDNHGDCVNCYRCVSVCPMGIDIRRGLQMECIACTACIDACDEIMEKVDKPKGLIRYSSLEQLSGKEKNGLGVRSLSYLFLLCIISTVFIYLVRHREVVDVKILRAIEAPYSVTGNLVINHFRSVIANQGKEVIFVAAPTTSLGEIVSPQFPVKVLPSEIKRVHFFIKINKHKIKKKALTLDLGFPIKGEEWLKEIKKQVTVLQP